LLSSLEIRKIENLSVQKKRKEKKWKAMFCVLMLKMKQRKRNHKISLKRKSI
jgi:hypothetical protein